MLADNGNVYDAIFLAAAAALRDTRVPKTKVVEYKARARAGGKMDGGDVEMKEATADGTGDRDQNSGLDTRAWKNATDFELEDYWDEGEPLKCRGSWPVCITINSAASRHFVDATSTEETAISLRLLLFYSFLDATKPARLQGMRLIGHGEAARDQIKSYLRVCVHSLIKCLNLLIRRNEQVGEKYARELKQALDRKLQSEQAKWYPKLKEPSKRK